MALTAQNVMTDTVLAVDTATPLSEVQRLFVEEGIHAAPVLDEQERPVGVIASSDLLRAVTEEQDTVEVYSDYLRDLLEFSAPDGGGPMDFQDRLAQRTAGEVMTAGLVMVDRDTPVSDVARLLRENRIHRVWVAEGEKLCGVISTFDLLGVVEKMA